MPYTTALRELPRFPAAQGQLTDAQGRPTRELYTLLRDIEEWMRAARAALDEIEATTFP